MVSSKKKGNRGEKEVVELLKKYWGDSSFMRAPDSGALSTMLEGFGAPQDVVGRLAGDILVPEDFPFCVESKLYAEIDLYQIIRNPSNCQIVQWWRQCLNDAKKAKKEPLLTFRENRKQRYVIIRKKFANKFHTKINCGYISTTFDKEDVLILSWDDFAELFPKSIL